MKKLIAEISRSDKSFLPAGYYEAIEKYGKELTDVVGEMFYISDKGNFVFQQRKIVRIPKKEVITKRIEDYKRYCRNLTPKEKRKYNYKANYYSCFSAYYNGDIDDVKIILRKIIITPKQVIFMQNGRKFYRISKKNTLEVLSNFVNEIDSVLSNGRIKNTILLELTKFLNQYFDFKSLKLLNLNSNIDSFTMVKAIKNNNVSLTKKEENYLRTINDNYTIVFDVEKIDALNKLHISNYDLRKKVVAWNFYGDALLKSKKYLNDLRKFYQNTPNINPDVVFLNRATKTKFFKDTISMYNLHKSHERMNPKIDKFPGEWYKLNFNDLHERLSRLIREDYAILQQIDYDYSDKVLGLEGTVDNYTFKFPKNSLEITRIANLLSNCVAGYSRGNNQYCLIMYGFKDARVLEYIKTGEGDVKELKKTEPLCIELTPYKEKLSEVEFKPSEVVRYGYFGQADNVVRQCYAPYNEYVSKETGDICNRYFDSIGYRHIDFTKHREILEGKGYGTDALPF